MKKKIKKINEFLDAPFELDAETEIKVVTDEEIKRRSEETAISEREMFANRKVPKAPPSKETFEIMVKMLLKSRTGTKEDVDNLSIRFYGEPYYKNNDDSNEPS